MSRVRFTINDDLVLLRQVKMERPYERPSKWNIILDRVQKATRKLFSMRSIKEHSDYLLKVYVGGQLRKIGTEAQHNEKQELLEIIHKKRRSKERTSSRRRSTREGKEEQINLEQNLTSETVIPKVEVICLNNEAAHNYNLILNEETALGQPKDAEPIPDNMSERSLPCLSTISGYHRPRDKDSAIALKEKQLAVEERKLALEERKLSIEETKLQMQQQERAYKMNSEMEDKRHLVNLCDQQQKFIDSLLQILTKKKLNK